MKTNSIIYMISAGILLASCSHHNPVEEQKAPEGENLITITEEQFKAGDLAIGEPVKMSFEDVVRCNGSIVTEPSGSVSISTPVQGIVKKILCSEGQKVSRGQALFELSGNEFIELQKDLAGTASQLKRLKSEYERIKSLYDEKIGTEKDLIMAESEYKVLNAEFSALRMKVRQLGFDEFKIENGNFYEFFSLTSPLNGFVSDINVSTGQYVDLQMALAEVFDPAKFRLKLAVFEKDFSNIKENQAVRFNLLGDADRLFSARITSTGKNVDEETKTIICYAQIDDPDGSHFVNNAYVEAAIVTKNDTAYAIPEESILRSEGSNYILEFVRNKNGTYYLRRTKADIGRTNKGFTEVLDINDDLKLITRGAYNIGVD